MRTPARASSPVASQQQLKSRVSTPAKALTSTSWSQQLKSRRWTRPREATSVTCVHPLPHKSKKKHTPQHSGQCQVTHCHTSQQGGLTAAPSSLRSTDPDRRNMRARALESEHLAGTVPHPMQSRNVACQVQPNRPPKMCTALGRAAGPENERVRVSQSGRVLDGRVCQVEIAHARERGNFSNVCVAQVERVYLAERTHVTHRRAAWRANAHGAQAQAVWRQSMRCGCGHGHVQSVPAPRRHGVALGCGGCVCFVAG